MWKVMINVSECEPGMTVAETVHNPYGAVVILENTILDAHLIRKLANLQISKIKVFSDTQNVIAASDSELFKAQYQENVQVIKGLLHDISIGQNVDVKEVDHVADSIFIRINENRDIISCINQIRAVNEYTYTHSVNVALISMLIGKWMKFDERKIKLLVQTGLLHDIGNSKISSNILNKPGKLTEEEFREVKKHPLLGYKIVNEIAGVEKEVGIGVLMHHEREDGSGYPMKIKGNQIHYLAKVIAVADIYDAMTSNRIYHEKDSPFEVFKTIENTSFGVLDTKVVNAFLSNIAAYYIGDFVRLNNGEIGEVVYINPRHVSCPIIKVNNVFLDLTQQKDLKIVELI